MKKIMVVDTQGGVGISDKYKRLLPNCTFKGYELVATAGTPCHPHGLMVAQLAGVIQTESTEIIFVRIFDERAQATPYTDAWLLAIIEQERPDVVIRSWGTWDQDSQMGVLFGEAYWREWVAKYEALQQELGFVDFAAAGNSDENDSDPDIDYPQALMPETSNIIGSCRRDGIPSEFSGDGDGVQCVAWAERIYLCDNGTFELGSGTSFAAPKMAGLCAMHGFNNEQWRSYVRCVATRPKGYEEVCSKKWGHGCMEDEYQCYLTRVPEPIHPPSVKGFGPLRIGSERWHDYHRVI